MKLAPETLEARRALLAKLDDVLRSGLSWARGVIDPNWRQREELLLRTLLEKDPVSGPGGKK